MADDLDLGGAPEGMMTLVDELTDKADEIEALDARGQIWELEEVWDIMRRAATRLRASEAATAAGERAGWQDISMAPRNGTRIDVWAFWPESRVYRRVPNVHWNVVDEDWQLGQYRRGQYVHAPDLPHWMPCPSTPPVAEEKL